MVGWKTVGHEIHVYSSTVNTCIFIGINENKWFDKSSIYFNRPQFTSFKDVYACFFVHPLSLSLNILFFPSDKCVDHFQSFKCPMVIIILLLLCFFLICFSEYFLSIPLSVLTVSIFQLKLTCWSWYNYYSYISGQKQYFNLVLHLKQIVRVIDRD